MIDPIERLVNDAVGAEINLYLRIRGRRDAISLREGRSLDDDPIANRMTARLETVQRIADAIDNLEYEMPFPEISTEGKAELLMMIKVNGAHWWAS